MSPGISSFFQSLAESRDSVLMDYVSEYRHFADSVSGTSTQAIREKSTEELFADFYRDRSGGAEPDEADLALLREAGELLRNSHSEHGRVDTATVNALLGWLKKQEVTKE